jgi:hypothetical protein
MSAELGVVDLKKQKDVKLEDLVERYKDGSLDKKDFKKKIVGFIKTKKDLHNILDVIDHNIEQSSIYIDNFENNFNLSVLKKDYEDNKDIRLIFCETLLKKSSLKKTI